MSLWSFSQRSQSGNRAAAEVAAISVGVVVGGAAGGEASSAAAGVVVIGVAGGEAAGDIT